MAAQNYPASLQRVLTHEGGFVNDPRDPGGATNRGVTQAVYDAYRAKKLLVKRSVRFIDAIEVTEIYKQQYWNKVKASQLPSGLDYAVFDFAVNSGVTRASKFLQRVVGVAEDGVIGPATLAAVAKYDPAAMVDALCNLRQAFLESLDLFATYGKGWTKRVAEVRVLGKAMA